MCVRARVNCTGQLGGIYNIYVFILNIEISITTTARSSIPYSNATNTLYFKHDNCYRQLMFTLAKSSYPVTSLVFSLSAILFTYNIFNQIALQ